MMRYSVQHRDKIFVKGYEFFTLAKDMGNIIGKDKSKNFNSKYGQKCLDHSKQSAAEAIRSTSKRVTQKTEECP